MAVRQINLEVAPPSPTTSTEYSQSQVSLRNFGMPPAPDIPRPDPVSDSPLLLASAEKPEPELQRGVAIANRYAADIDKFAAKFGVSPEILRSVIIAESGWSNYDSNPLVQGKLQLNPRDVSVGVGQMKLSVAASLLYGKETLSNEEYRELGNRLVSNPSLAIGLSAKYLNVIETKLRNEMNNSGYSLAPNRLLSDFSAREISTQDYRMAIMAGYNLGTARLDGTTYQQGTNKPIDKVQLFVEMARHNYVTGVEARGSYPIPILNELGLLPASRSEMERAARWKDYVSGRIREF